MDDKTAIDIMQALRDSTRPAHGQIEATTPITALIEGKGGISDFVGVLKASLSYYRPLEKQLMETADPQIRDFMKPRLKTDIIKRDLARLGVSETEIEAIPDYQIPKLDTPEAVLGALYVLEGSTLGGKVITMKLKEHFGWEMLDSEHFLNPYGNEVMPRWKEFGGFVREQFSSRNLDKDAIVSAANETFTAYNDCLAGKQQERAREPEKEDAQAKPSQPAKQRGRWPLRKSLTVIAAGTLAGATVGAGTGAFGGQAVRGWLSQGQAQTSTETGADGKPDRNENSSMVNDALIGAAVFGAYSLRGMIVTVFGVQGLRAGWRKLTRDEKGNKKCPFHR